MQITKYYMLDEHENTVVDYLLNEKYKPIPLNADDSIYCCGKVISIVEE